MNSSNNHELLLKYAAEMLAMRQTSAQDFSNSLPALIQAFQDSASARLAELQAVSGTQSPLLEQRFPKGMNELLDTLGKIAALLPFI